MVIYFGNEGNTLVANIMKENMTDNPLFVHPMSVNVRNNGDL